MLEYHGRIGRLGNESGEQLADGVWILGPVFSFFVNCFTVCQENNLDAFCLSSPPLTCYLHS